MALLQLAENYLAEENNPLKDYIFIPAGMYGVTEDTYVRQDFFDGLSDTEFQAVISALAPFQNTGLSAGLDIVASVVGGIPVVGNTGKAVIDIAGKLVKGRKDRLATGKANPTLKGKSGSLIAKVKTGIAKITAKPDATKSIPVDVSGNVGGTSFDISTGSGTNESFFTKYKTPLLIGGGLVGAFLLYKAIKK